MKPVTQTSDVTSGCQIIYPKIENIKQGNDYTFHFHVINNTGKILNQSSVTCIFNLYNSQGHHSYINQNVSFGTNTITDFEVFVNGSQNFTTRGDQAYTFQCYNGNIGCFVSNPIAVSGTGRDPPGDNVIIFAYVVFILASIFVMVSLFLIIAKFATLDMTLYDLILSYGSYLLFVVSYFLSTTYIQATFIEDMTNNLLLPLGVTHIFISLLAFIVTFFYKGTMKKQNPTVRDLNGGMR